MKRSTPETNGEAGGTVRPPDDRSGGIAFAAPLESTGTPQKRLVAHIIVLPGGTLLVDEKLSHLFGKPLSGPIECKNGRD